MIYLVHGEDYAKSRAAVLGQQKKLAKERVEVGIKDVTPKQLGELVSTFDLFGNPPFVVLDISGAGNMGLDEYVSEIKKTPQESIIIILSGKELGKTNAFVKNATLLNLKIVTNQVTHTSNIFRFVDALYAKNRKATYRELGNLIREDNDPFYVFSMIIYGARKNFGLKGVNKDLFEGLYNLDKKVKTGQIPQDMFLPSVIEKVLAA